MTKSSGHVAHHAAGWLRLTNVGARPHPARHTIGDRRATRPRNYAKSRSRSHDAVIRVYDEAGDVIETTQAGGRVLNVHKIRVDSDNKR